MVIRLKTCDRIIACRTGIGSNIFLAKPVSFPRVRGSLPALLPILQLAFVSLQQHGVPSHSVIRRSAILFRRGSHFLSFCGSDKHCRVEVDSSDSQLSQPRSLLPVTAPRLSPPSYTDQSSIRPVWLESEAAWRNSDKACGRAPYCLSLPLLVSVVGPTAFSASSLVLKGPFTTVAPPPGLWSTIRSIPDLLLTKKYSAARA